MCIYMCVYIYVYSYIIGGPTDYFSNGLYYY